MNVCINCGKNAKNKFCSRSCAVSYNNKYRTASFKKLKRIKISKNCKKCGKEFEIERILNKDGIQRISKKSFCSRSCANGRIHTEETKKKIGESLVIDRPKIFCKNCGKEIGYRNKSGYCKDCISKYRDYKAMAKKAAKTKTLRNTHSGWQSRNIKSYAEKFFVKVLKNNNLYKECKLDHPVKKKDLGLDCNANYFLDFFFEDKMIDLEIDGRQHEDEDRKRSDKTRDKNLMNNGYKIYRIKWKNPINKENKAYIRTEINKFLEFYNGQ